MKDFGTKGVYLYVELYENAGRLQEAMDYLDKVIMKDPHSTAFKYAKGRLLLRTGQYKLARQLLEEASENAPLHLERLHQGRPGPA